MVLCYTLIFQVVDDVLENGVRRDANQLSLSLQVELSRLNLHQLELRVIPLGFVDELIHVGDPAKLEISHSLVGLSLPGCFLSGKFFLLLGFGFPLVHLRQNLFAVGISPLHPR